MAGATSEACCICLMDYEPPEQPFTLSCGHAVHSHCMLRLCLTSAGSHRCPYCRNVLRDSTTETTSTDSDSEDIPVPQLAPVAGAQWLRLTWSRHAHGPRRRQQELVAKRVLEKGRRRDAPWTLRRYAAAHAELRKRSVEQTRTHAKLKVSRAKGTMSEVLVALRKSSQATEKLRQQISRQLEQSLLRIRADLACREFLNLHAPRHVPP